VSLFSPYDYAFHEDPYPIYERLRREAPLYRNDEFDFWALSRHVDVLGAFRDIDGFSNANGVSLDPSAYGPHASQTMSFLAMDPPKHTRIRKLANKGFTPRTVAQLEERVREITIEHLEPALALGTFDFIADFAGKVPMDVISELIGVPRADRAELRRLADLVVHRQEGLFDVPVAGQEAALEMVVYFAEMVADRRRHLGDDLTSELIEADIEGDRLNDEELIAFLFLMVVAGNETTTKLLGNAWYWAWRNPNERAKPFGDAARVPAWVEETLRFDNSSQMVLRTLKRDLTVDGTTVAAGERVLLLIGSANRDETVFVAPERYDLDRDTTKSLSFGNGRHFCMGAPLARLEGRVALEELVRRVADYEIDMAGTRWVHSSNVRGFETLATTVEVR
jgi:cytochrome P450